MLCWSVMGWPSTENEFEAWSPSPWNRPFESAATPGRGSGDQRAERGRLALQRHLAEQIAVDVGVEGGIGFDEIAVGLNGDGLRTRGHLERKLEARTHNGANIETLAQRTESAGRDIEMVGIERNVGERELALRIAGRVTIEPAAIVVKMNSCIGDDGASGIDNGSLHRACVATLCG